jgi:hypothetical protein
MEEMFRGAKVGDKVWDFLFGWGFVIGVDFGDEEYPISVEFNDKEQNIWYSYSGVRIGTGVPTLFWDEVKFVAPPKPKRKVKKELEGWLNIYYFSGEMFVKCYKTKAEAEADRYGDEERIEEARRIEVEVECEVEE